jgi:hypothetical protein
MGVSTEPTMEQVRARDVRPGAQVWTGAEWCEVASRENWLGGTVLRFTDGERHAYWPDRLVLMKPGA